MKLGVTVGLGDLEAKFGEFETEITDIVRGITVELFYSILARTPQYYGGMAASWSYNYNGVAYDRSRMIEARQVPPGAALYGEKADFNVRRKGDEWAINIAATASAGRDQIFQLGKKVYITNGVTGLEGPYASIVEGWDSSPPLRSVNLPGTPMKRALDMIESKYGAGVKKAAVPSLRAWKIGGSGAASDT